MSFAVRRYSFFCFVLFFLLPWVHSYQLFLLILPPFLPKTTSSTGPLPLSCTNPKQCLLLIKNLQNQLRVSPPHRQPKPHREGEKRNPIWVPHTTERVRYCIPHKLLATEKPCGEPFGKALMAMEPCGREGTCCCYKDAAKQINHKINQSQLVETMLLERHLYHLAHVNWTHGSGPSLRNKKGFITRWGSKQRNWPWKLGYWPSWWSAVTWKDPGHEVKAIQIVWEVKMFPYY